jgi:hypothetical protein
MSHLSSAVLIRVCVHVTTRTLQEAERTKLQERLGKWQVAALQQLLDVFDLPKPSSGTKVSHGLEQRANTTRL